MVKRIDPWIEKLQTLEIVIEWIVMFPCKVLSKVEEAAYQQGLVDTAVYARYAMALFFPFWYLFLFFIIVELGSILISGAPIPLK